jgi:pilus assembly protein CpaC
VVGKKEFRDHQVLQRVMSKMMGLHLDINDGAPTITGQLLRVKDWVEITKAGQTNSAKYRFRAEIDELIKPKVLAYLKQTLKNSALPSYKILLDPHPQFIIPKASDEKSLHPLLESVAKSHGIEIFEDSNALDILPMIKVRIFVAEIKKKAFQRIGLGPPTSASAQLVPAIGIGPLAATLNFLEERGDATLLASPSLLCRSGKEAEFLAGGEIPIKISGFGSKEVVWRKYGILLKVKPKATWDGRMSVDLLTEVSNLDPAQTVEGVPGLLTNRIQSHFDLEGTQTIALSGLIRHDKGFSAEGWPGLNRIPILGSLFSSQDYRDQKTELVFFVRPEVTDSAANGEFNQSWDDPSIKSENEFNSPSEPRTEEGSLHE